MRYALIILLLSFSIDSWATGQVSLSLTDSINKYWDDSAILKQLSTQVNLAEKDRWRRFVPNEPQFSYQKDNSDRSQVYSLSLTMGFPGKAFAFAKVDDAALEKQNAELFAKRQELGSMVAQAYVTCAAAQAIISVQEKALSNLETFLQILKSRRGVTQSERLSLELETRQNRRDLQLSRDQCDVACSKFKQLVPESSADVSSLVLPEDLDKEILDKMGSAGADEARARAAIDYANASYSVAGWSQMPDLTLSYGRKYAPEAQLNTTSGFDYFGISFNIPLFYPIHESTESTRAKSQALLDRSAAQLQNVQVSSDRQEAAKAFVRNRNQLADIRKNDLPMARALLESSYSAYRAGQLGYAEMALSRKTITDLYLKDIELRSLVISARLKCLDVCEDNFTVQEKIQ
jgi:outer membrane protein TolC